VSSYHVLRSWGHCLGSLLETANSPCMLPWATSAVCASAAMVHLPHRVSHFATRCKLTTVLATFTFQMALKPASELTRTPALQSSPASQTSNGQRISSHTCQMSLSFIPILVRDSLRCVVYGVRSHFLRLLAWLLLTKTTEDFTFPACFQATYGCIWPAPPLASERDGANL